MNITMREDLDFPYQVIHDTFDGDIVLLDDSDYESDEPFMDGFGAIAAAADEAALLAMSLGDEDPILDDPDFENRNDRIYGVPEAA